MCAIRSKCLVTTDKQVFCTKHKQKAAKTITTEIMSTKRADRKFVAMRKICIPVAHEAHVFGRADMGLRLGALTVISFGRIIYDCPAFHTGDSLYPVGYTCTRKFWSCVSSSGKRSEKRSDWRLEVQAGRGEQFPVFKASSAGRTFIATSPAAVWAQILKATARNSVWTPPHSIVWAHFRHPLTPRVGSIGLQCQWRRLFWVLQSVSSCVL